MRDPELEAIWAETCALDSAGPEQTLARIGGTAAGATPAPAVVARVRPTPAPLERSALARHAAPTVDLSAATRPGGAAAIAGETLQAPADGASDRPVWVVASQPRPARAEAIDTGGVALVGVLDETISAAASGAAAPAHGDDADARVTLPAKTVADAGVTGGGYALLDRLGEGGMGIVWRARQASLDRQVAVKTLRPELDHGLTRAQFIAEATVTGALDHPNIVPVHDLGVGPDGSIFLAMKLVEGHAWADLLHPRTEAQRAEAPRLDLRRHLEILGHVANAVAFAHSRGIVHRDLKPANVMVGAWGEVLVMDWGIAVDVREPPAGDAHAPHRSTITGPAGTPSYMAPEQARGDAKAIGPATDVFLLGAMLHEVVTGAPPYLGRTLLEVLYAAARAERPPWPAEAPAALLAVCERAMAADPAARYPDARAFAEALRAYLAHEASLRVSDQGLALVAELERGEVERSERYARWMQALARFEQARELWAENEAAERGRAAASLGLAGEALARGDIGLAQAHLPVLQSLAAAGDLRAGQAVATLDRLQLRAHSARAFVVVALASAIGVGVLLTNVAERAQERATRAAAHERRAARQAQAWAAVARGDLAGAWAAWRERAQDDGAAVDAETEALRSSLALLAWQRREPVTAWGLLCPEAGHGPGTARLRRSMRTHAAVRATGLADALSDRGARSGADRGALCEVVRDALQAGAPAAAGLAAVAVLEDASAPDRADPAWRAALRRGAVCALSGDDGGCGGHALPFVLDLPGPTLPAPHLARDASGGWVAHAAGAARAAWRGTPAPKGAGSAIAVPRSDGAVVLGEGAALLLRRGDDGTLLARVGLPGRAVQAFPDPAARDQLVVLVEIAPGAIERVRIDPEWPAAPAWLGAGLSQLLRPRPYWSTLLADAFDEAARRRGRVVGDALLDGTAWHEALERAVAEGWRDRRDPEALLAIVEAAAGVQAPWRAQLADAALTASAHLGATWHRSAGARLLRAGAPDAAERAWQRARSQPHIHPELEWRAGDTDSGLLVAATAAAHQRGDLDQARRLADEARATRAWLPPPLAGVVGIPSARGEPAAALRGHALLSDELLERTDMALVATLGAAPWLALLLLALWVRSRAARHADLCAAGYPSRLARWAGLVREPGERWRLTFAAYLSRPERLALAIAAALLLALSMEVLRDLGWIARVEASPVALGRANLADPQRIVALEARPGGDPLRDAARARLLAESYHAVGSGDAAERALRAVLAAAPTDAAAQVNLGVLAWERGQRAQALALWGAVDHPTARDNLARGHGDAPLGPPVWELSRATDLAQLWMPSWRDAAETAAAALTGRPAALRAWVRAGVGTNDAIVHLGLLAACALAAATLLLALWSLPLPVRSWQRATAPWWRWLWPGLPSAAAGRGARAVVLGASGLLGLAAGASALGLGLLPTWQGVALAALADDETRRLVGQAAWSTRAAALCGGALWLLHVVLAASGGTPPRWAAGQRSRLAVRLYRFLKLKRLLW